MSLTVALLLSLGSLAVGDGLLRALGLRRAGFERLALTIAAGLAASLVVLYLPLAVTGRAWFLPLAVLQVGSALAGLPPLVRGWRRPTPRAWLAAAAFLLACLGVARVAAQTPFSAYDDRAIYGLKGKVLWLERDVQGAVFSDLEVINYHRDYPLGLPLLIAHAAWSSDPQPTDPAGSTAAAGANEWVERYDAVSTYAPWSVLWLAGLGALAVALVLRASERPLVRLALLPLTLPLALVFPWIAGDSWSLSGADLPMSLLVGGLAWSLVAWWRDGEGRWLGLAGLLACAMFLIKQDALLSLCAAAGAWILARGPRPALTRIAGLAAALILTILVVRYAGRAIPTPTFEEDYGRALGEGSLGAWLERVPLILAGTWKALDRGHMSAFWLVALFVALPLGLRRGGWPRFLALWIALHLALTLCVFVVTPDQVAWHVRTAFTRILCHLAVPAGMLLVEYAREPLEALRRQLASSPAP